MSDCNYKILQLKVNVKNYLELGHTVKPGLVTTSI
jgi:hypothetical protein